MLLRELKELVESTADAAFVVDSTGVIVAWNMAAAAMFCRSAAEAVGQRCAQVLQGVDECGPVCSAACSIRQAAQAQHPLSNFDMQVPTLQGTQWCNVSTLCARVTNSATPFALHIIRGIDVRKRLELLVRDFLVSEAKLPPEQARVLVATSRSPARFVELTRRELEVLRLLAKGTATRAVANQLHISRTTVNNHIQRILHKLNAHSRLEAIRRAEHAGLI
jgi:PAS domain S-box-containing protein